MKIPTTYILYVVAAVIVGLVFSIGIVGSTHNQAPLQVQLQQYQPAAPPAPAIPTQAPQLVVDNTVKTGDFDPAPAPVVVTTAPLPTITPVADATKKVGKCDVKAGDSATSLACVNEEVLGNIQSAVNLIGILMLIMGVMVIIYSLSGLVSLDGRGGGGMMLITAAIMCIVVGGVMLLIGNVIMNSLVAAMSYTSYGGLP